jgi:FkbM family methyltransferase
MPLVRAARKAEEARIWMASVLGPRDWPSALLLAIFRTRPPVGPGTIARWARRLFVPVWIRPRRLNGLRLRIDPASMSQFTIYEEVLIGNAYDLDLLAFTPDAVIDCGAFEGYFSLLARARYGEVPIIAFEPNAENFAGLVANIGGNGLSIDARASAVSVRDGVAQFSGDGCGGRITAGGDGQSAAVPLVDLRRVIAELGPSRLLMKIDVEGEEQVILPQILGALPRTCALFFEWHHGADLFDRAVALLERAGFSVEERRRVVQPDSGETFIDAFAQRA